MDDELSPGCCAALQRRKAGMRRIESVRGARVVSHTEERTALHASTHHGAKGHDEKQRQLLRYK